MKNSDKPTCGDFGGNKKNGEPCSYVAGWGTDFEEGMCKKHRGTSPDGESHKGNQHAMKTGIHSDPLNLLNWVAENDESGLKYIFFKLREYADESEKPVFEADVRDADDIGDVQGSLTGHGDELLRISVQDYSRWRGTKRQVEEGLITEQTRQGEHGPYQVEDSNPVNLDLDRLERTGIKQKEKYDVLPSSESSAAEELGKIARQALED